MACKKKTTALALSETTVNDSKINQVSTELNKEHKLAIGLDTGCPDLDALTARVDQNEADITDLKADLKQFNGLKTYLFEQGGLSAVNVGQPLRLVDTANAIRSIDFADWEAGMRVSLNEGYQARLMLCDNDGNYIVDKPWAQTVTSNNTVATKVKVLIRKSDSTAITPDEAISAVSFSSIDISVVEEKANKSVVDALNTQIATFEENEAYCYNTVQIALENGIYDRWNNFTGTGKHITVPVNKGDKYLIVAQSYPSTDYPVYILKKGNTVVKYQNESSAQMVQIECDVSVDADTLIVNSGRAYIALSKGSKVRAKPYSKWDGKKIAWFGTSIPETSSYNAVLGYPEFVGRLLGATVYNEAVGSSCARRGFKTAETANDPYGWTGMGIAALWNMGSTIAEKNELISNWESKWRNLTGYNVTMTDSISAKAIACSYENKLVQKYITENPVDLYVLDHGYNDWKVGDLDANSEDPFDRSTFQGAMNTFIKLILEANPRAKILIVSHYEDQERPGLIDMQKLEAEYWNLPFARLYEYLGWANNRTVTTTGYWSKGTGNGIWVESGGTEQTLTLKQYHMPDGRHPNIDITGKACMDIAYVLADVIDSITPSN